MIQPYGFGNLVVANKNGVPIYLKQIAEVEDTQAELETGAFQNGKTAVSVDILRSSDANVIQVVDNTYKVLDKIKAQLPKGASLHVVVDTSKVSALQLRTLHVPSSKVPYWQF